MPIWRSSPVDDHADAVGERRRVLEVVRDEQRPGSRGRRAARAARRGRRPSCGRRARRAARRGAARPGRARARARARRAGARRRRAPPGGRARGARSPKRSRYSSAPVPARVLDVLADGQVREERVVLEDEPDAAPVRRRATMPRPPSNHDLVADSDAARRRPHEPGDRAQHRRLAGARRPDERDASSRPSRLSRRLERPKRDGDLFEGERLPCESDSEAEEQDDADQDEHAAHRERRVEVPVELGVDRERQRLGDALQAAGEHDRGAELAEPAREREREPGDQPAARERQDDAEERARRARRRACARRRSGSGRSPRRRRSPGGCRAGSRRRRPRP